jgi:hypothetical protein
MRLQVLLLGTQLMAFSVQGQQTEIDRALIQRDRQSAEFSRPELRDLHQRQDMRQGPSRPDERVMQARERESFPSEQQAPQLQSYKPLPLPGGPRPLVDPIPVQGVGP